MARATRSSKQQAKEPSPAPSPPPKPKGGPKKRKRTSLAEPDGQPALKLSRTASEETERAVKEEDAQAPKQEDAAPPAVTPAVPERPTVGDLPIDAADAQKILDVLEMCVAVSLPSGGLGC